MVVSGYTNMQDKQANLAVSLHWVPQVTRMFILFFPHPFQKTFCSFINSLTHINSIQSTHCEGKYIFTYPKAVT